MLFGTYEITPIEFYARELNTCIETTVDNYTGEVHVYDGNSYSENKNKTSGGGSDMIREIYESLFIYNTGYVFKQRRVFLGVCK